jgi:hypothetical protein
VSDEFKLKPGESFDLTLRRPDREEKPAGAPARRPGLVGEDSAESRYVSRGKLTIEVFDLGTRLRSVAPTVFDGKRVRLRSELTAPEVRDDYFNEYVETEYTASGAVEVGPSESYIRLNLTDAEVRDLDAQALGVGGDALDPFGFTPANGSRRKVPNCMPLPYANDYQIDLMVGEERYALAAPDGRATFAHSDLGLPGDGAAVPAEARDAWRRREAKDADSSEQWNPVSRGEGGSAEFVGGEWRYFGALNPAFGQGTLKPRGGAGKRLAVAHGHDEPPSSFNPGFGLFETFDTADTTNFKVTTEPSFEADEAGFRLTNVRTRVYLKPRLVKFYWGIFDLINFTLPLGDQVMFAGRLPLYPFPPAGDLRAPSAATVAAYLAREPQARAAVVRNRALYPGATGHPGTDSSVSIYELPGTPPGTARNYLNYSQVGMLVAVVVAGGAKYYVWRRTQAAARNAGTFLVASVNVPEVADLY